MTLYLNPPHSTLSVIAKRKICTKNVGVTGNIAIYLYWAPLINVMQTKDFPGDGTMLQATTD
jgi:hypothetical protein